MINVGLEKVNKLKQDSQSEVTLLVPNKLTKMYYIEYEKVKLVSVVVCWDKSNRFL